MLWVGLGLELSQLGRYLALNLHLLEIVCIRVFQSILGEEVDGVLVFLGLHVDDIVVFLLFFVDFSVRNEAVQRFQRG